MVSLRYGVPLLGLLALIALFLKLPETPNLFGIFACKSCTSTDPYLPLIGAGYFTLLIATSILFPLAPTPPIARAGMLWAVLLAFTLTYLNMPGWCVDCLIGHACNIAIWAIWLFVPNRSIKDKESNSTVRERFCLLLFAPMAVVALFSCLNLTFMAYSFKLRNSFVATSLQAGDTVPPFSISTGEKGDLFNDADLSSHVSTVFNFVAPNCPFCKEQLPLVNEVALKFADASCRFINISPSLENPIIRDAPAVEWMEDSQGHLRALFHVSGYPTLFVVGKDAKINEVITGVPDSFKSELLSAVKNKGILMEN